MKHKLKVLIISSLYLLTVAEGAEVASSRLPVDPPIGHYVELFPPLPHEGPTNESAKIGVISPITIHAQVYPVPPIRLQSRTTVAKAKLIDIKVMKNADQGIPMQKVTNAKELGKVQSPLEKFAELDLTVPEIPFYPIVKLDEAKETMTDKTQIPVDINGEVTDHTNEIKINGTNDNVLNYLPLKLEETLEPKLDLGEVVFNAFTQTIFGDGKVDFKQAMSRLSNAELGTLYQVLLNTFRLKGIVPPGIGIGTDLKDVIQGISMNDRRSVDKSTLIGDVIAPEMDFTSEPVPVNYNSTEKPMEVFQTPWEIVPQLQIDVDNSTYISDNAKNSSVPSLEAIMDGTEKSTDESNEKFVNNMDELKNVVFRRPWEMASPRHKRISNTQSSNMKVNWGRGKRSIYGIGTASQELHNFLPPASLRIPMKTAFRQVNSAAPPDPYPKSKESLSLPILSINEVATDKIMMDIKEGLQYVLQTRNDWTFAIHGTGTTGCHAVLDNLIESGDTVLALVNGYWGELMANMSERLGAHVVRYNRSPGTIFTLNEIDTALRTHRPDLVLVVQGESSTTVNQPLDGIGDLCAKNGALLVADVVAVAGIQPILMDKNKIDGVFTSTHKGLGSIAGLAPISLSPRAVQKMKSRLTPPRAYQTDLTMQRELWNTDNPDRLRFQSMSLPLLYGIREALATIVEERMENTFKRHAQTTDHLNRGLAALGLKHFVESPKDRLIGITAVMPPIGKDPKKIANYMFRNYNIDISTGLGPTEGKVLRFATFGSNAETSRISNLLRALKNALNSRETSISW